MREWNYLAHYRRCCPIIGRNERKEGVRKLFLLMRKLEWQVCGGHKRFNVGQRVSRAVTWIL